jgi:hypothetical protein
MSALPITPRAWYELAPAPISPYLQLRSVCQNLNGLTSLTLHHQCSYGWAGGDSRYEVNPEWLLLLVRLQRLDLERVQFTGANSLLAVLSELTKLQSLTIASSSCMSWRRSSTASCSYSLPLSVSVILEL